MRTNSLLGITPSRALAVLTCVIGLVSSTAVAQTHHVDLIAAELPKTVTLPSGAQVSVPMWGFALDGGTVGTLDPSDVPTVPGPRIVVPPGTTTLEITLRNALTGAGAEPVSLVIPGQAYDASAPVFEDGRIFSMTPVATPGGPSVTYQFTNLKAGTFLYQSGAHQAVQVQMGLYGAMTMNVTDPAPAVPATESAPATPAVPGLAYAGVAFDNEVVLLYSEIDIALHEAVAAGDYGTAPTSTIDYAPSLYLVNGESYANDLATPPIAAGASGQVTLLRLLNAGLKSHAPLLDNGALSIVAEDGNKYPFARAQAALLLAAGKTHDARWTPSAPGVYSVYDRLLGLNAEGQGSAGMLAKLRVGASPGAPSPPADTPTAAARSYSTPEDTPLPVGAATGLLSSGSIGTEAHLVTAPVGGVVTAVNTTDGSFTYVPGPNFSGVDSFMYATGNGSQTSVPATVLISVSPVQDGPAAIPQELRLKAGESLPVVLAGTDPDGDALTFQVTTLPNATQGKLSLIDPVTSILGAPLTAVPVDVPNGSLVYTAVAPGAFASFSFVAKDATTTSAQAQVSVALVAPETADACPPGVTCTPVTIRVNGGSVTSFRWTVEEDQMFPVIPGELGVDNTPSVNFHKSYMPVVQSGAAGVDELGEPTGMPTLDPAKRYFVSVLPMEGGLSNGGATILPGQTSVDVKVDVGKIPTAQVRVRVFRDDTPLNGNLDNVEAGLPDFAVTLEDAGGRYGMSAAQQLMDAFGNPLGTRYKPCSSSCESYEVLTYGNGFVLTDADGYALFEHLVPGKYGVNVIPRSGEGEWQQTTTIEGKKAIDAWVKAKEPTYFSEFGGPPGPHAVIGFARKTNLLTGAAGSVIKGQITNLRLARPPDPSMHSGAPFDFTRPWVALNTGTGAGGSLVYAAPTGDEGIFEITGVAPGPYTLVVFDSALNVLIASKAVTATGGTVDLGAVPVMQWFTRSYNYVFEDSNEDGFRQDGEAGMPEQAVNLRFRDGSVYQSAPTDRTGFVPFEEVFPFFAWLVAEVDYTRNRATGVTAVIDNGGPVANAIGDPLNAGWPASVGAEVDPRVLSPQIQSAADGSGQSRTETGTILLEGFQGFIGQSHVLLWGKSPYPSPSGTVVREVDAFPFDDPDVANDFPGTGDTDIDGDHAFDGDQFNGGVAGIVHYSTTRAENDPRWGGAEVWEPGIPRVKVQLWDVNRTKLLNEVATDSWDDSQPTDCVGPVYSYRGTPRDCFDGLRNWNQVRPAVFDGGYQILSQIEPTSPTPAAWLTPVAERGAGFRKVPLPAGKYVVKVIVPDGYKVVGEEDKNVDFGSEYIPPEFLLDGYPLADGEAPGAPGVPRVENTPLAAPFCVGSLHEVPGELALFPGVPGAYSGQMRPACDAKLVTLRNGQNPGANFFLFTEAPIAGHITGFVLDDTANELDPNSPTFGEKYAPPFLPVAVRDWTGREIVRTYTDSYGGYNALVPSTFTGNVPAPSGVSASVLAVCVNAPTFADGAPDPHFNPKYSHSCFPLQFMPGTTTYLDTPVLPTAAFQGADQYPVDTAFPARTPVIKQVTNVAPLQATFPGPYIVDCVNATGGNQTGDVCGSSPASRAAARTVVITAVGSAEVPNPYYDGLAGTQPKMIPRDYGFGDGVTLGSATNRPNGVVKLNGVALGNADITAWTNTQITAVVPSGVNWRTGQLTVDRCLARTGGEGTAGCTEWRPSVVGVTLTVATPSMHQARPPVVVPAGGSIQAAINAAVPGALVLVSPGNYEEMVVMTKPVRLQGQGAAVTRINVVQSPAENLQAWRDFVGGVLTDASYLLTEQAAILGAPPFADGILAATLGGEGGGVTVLGKSFPTGNATAPVGNLNGYCGPPLAQLPVDLTGGLLTAARLLPDFGLSSGAGVNAERYCLQNENFVSAVLQRGSAINAEVWRPNARIDGFSIHGSPNAAGVMVNGNARYLEIANNQIFNNTSPFAGGIKVGHPAAELPLVDEDANNRSVSIHNNKVTENASLEGLFGGAGGGGIVIGTGASNYLVRNNWVAGNFGGGPGGGISHLGLSPNGVIDRNTIVFNESFNQGVTISGGGVFVGGRPPAAGALSPGSGSVRVSNNVILGNQAAAGDGGGISLAFVNGQDLTSATPDYRVDVFNNVIANNEAAFAGGGIALQDAVNVRIVHNTIVHNDSLATAGASFAPGSPQQSTPQPAGIASRGHVQAGLPGNFSSPTLVNSIVWHNRSFYFGLVTDGVQNPGAPGPTYGLINTPASVAGTTACAGWTCWDLGVLGAPAGSALDPQYSVLSNTAGYAATNVSDAPAFVAQYLNGPRNPSILVNEGAGTATILVPAAFDEGGNFIRPIFGPLTLTAANGSTFFGNHHVTAGVGGRALNALFGGLPNVPGTLLLDIDGEARPGQPSAGDPHRGADQLAAPQPSAVSVGDASITEGSSGTAAMTFTVSLSAPSTSSIDLRYTTTNGTAIGGASACAPAPGQCDYVSIPAATVLSFSPGQVSQDVTVDIKGDTMYEGNQAFNLVVTLAPGETDATIADGTGVGTILDNDPTPTVAINDPAPVTEPTGGFSAGNSAPATFTVTLTGAHESSASVAWSTSNGTAQGGVLIIPALQPNVDFRTSAGVVNFGATANPSAQSNVTVPIYHNSAGDPAGSGTETFFVNLSLPNNVTITDPQGMGTIVNRP